MTMILAACALAWAAVALCFHRALTRPSPPAPPMTRAERLGCILVAALWPAFVLGMLFLLLALWDLWLFHDHLFREGKESRIAQD